MRLAQLTALSIVCFSASVVWAGEPSSATQNGSSISRWSVITISCAAITLAALIALVLLSRKLILRRARLAKNDPGQLLRELCQAHGLSRRAERLLKNAAAAVGTPHPGRFFLEPQLLRQAEECDELKRSRRTLRLLRDRLFGEKTA